MMTKVRTGDVLSCEVCGLSVIVDEDCGCAITEIICCEEAMVNKGQIPPKNKSVAVAAPKKKAAAKKTKPATKKKIAKKPVKKSVKKTAPKKKVAKKKTTKK
jgi:hypothetical protein